MSLFNNAIIGASGQQGYQISRSVRTRSSASAYFSRSFTTPTSQQKGTFSFWLKRGTLGARNNLFSNDNGTQYGFLEFDVNNLLSFSDPYSAGACNLITTQVFRDPSAWYHLILAFDTTQATAANRAKFYVNGVQITSFGTAVYPSQNATLYMLQAASAVQIAAFTRNGTPTFDGYLTEFNFVDGQQLTPSSFGQTNSVTGVWQPIKYGGTYGTNGFYLNFSDNSNNTATTIGKDYSGNGNNWTPNNISVTAGVTYDSMLDVPTPYADGGNGRGNYAVMNPLQLPTAASTVLSNANLLLTCNSGTSFNSFSNGTMYPTSGKYYAEFYINTVGECYVGISRFTDASTPNSWNSQSTYYNRGGVIQKDGSTTASVATYTTGDTIGVAYDVDNATCAFYKNNTLVGTVTGVTAGSYTFSIAGYLSCAVSFNTGQRPFSYTPPTGFVALNTQNLPTPTISNGANYMAATLYTGNGGTQSITNTVNGISFQPDLVWNKSRSTATAHNLTDSVRGVQKSLFSNSTAAELASCELTAFNSNGYTLVRDAARAEQNENTVTYVGWQWKAGTTSSSNTSGSITSTVSAGATQGFSVVTYTGTGANATVGHGLGVAPSFLILKCRNNNSGATSWTIATSAASFNWATDYYQFDTAAKRTNGAGTVFTSAPSSTVLNIGTSNGIGQSGGTMVAYCWAEVAGYSKFGSYTGNGSADGPFVYLGFRPRFVMVKNTSTAATDWITLDSARDTYNVTTKYLKPNLSDAEGSGSGMQFLSNGFKWQNDTGTSVNQSGATFIYMAFAENPFKNSLAR